MDWMESHPHLMKRLAETEPVIEPVFHGSDVVQGACILVGELLGGHY